MRLEQCTAYEIEQREYIEDVHDELIERYFLDVESYFDKGYQV